VDTKLKILCQPQEGSRPFRFEWHKNGRLLSEATHRIETSDDDSLFVIDKLTTTDSANYSCSVRNDFGADTQFTILTVKGLLSFWTI